MKLIAISIVIYIIMVGITVLFVKGATSSITDEEKNEEYLSSLEN